jgi:membrane-bound lytic murein transglycosylase B
MSLIERKNTLHDQWNTVEKWQELGFNITSNTPLNSINLNESVWLVDVPSSLEPLKYYFGTKNFWVLTRYNRSFFYALSVIELGHKIYE